MEAEVPSLPLDAPDKLPGWPVTFSSPDDKVLTKINLKNLAVSGSGVQKGKHIINPHTGRPVEDKLGAWVCCSDAATGRCPFDCFYGDGYKGN